MAKETKHIWNYEDATLENFIDKLIDVVERDNNVKYQSVTYNDGNTEIAVTLDGGKIWDFFHADAINKKFGLSFSTYSTMINKRFSTPKHKGRRRVKYSNLLNLYVY